MQAEGDRLRQKIKDEMTKYRTDVEPLRKEATRAKILDAKVESLEQKLKSMTDKFKENIESLKRENSNY